jgi:hypothetical protein
LKNLLGSLNTALDLDLIGLLLILHSSLDNNKKERVKQRGCFRQFDLLSMLGRITQWTTKQLVKTTNNHNFQVGVKG